MRPFHLTVKTLGSQFCLSVTNRAFCEQRRDDFPEGDGTAPTDAPRREALFYGLFPSRQLFQPKLPYPLWDYDWDGRLHSQQSTHALRKHGVTRHIILIRHGQYDESHRNDEARVLTPLGELQAHQTGQRLAQLIHNIHTNTANAADHDGAQTQQAGRLVAIRVSNLTRAKQTADIISSYLPPSVRRFEPDTDLNEGRPCHTIPCTDKPIVYTAQDHFHDLDEADPHVDSRIQPFVSSSVIRQTDEGHERIERAFHRYFYRYQHFTDTQTTTTMEEGMDENLNHNSDSSSTPIPPTVRHEYEIIVCHANVIRYFVCRALQIPPEAWLRFCIFNCSLTYLTIRPTGTVSCRMIGDIGHLDYELSTFSMHHGFNW
jgi:serine/threonine-protein phosphatase PGAM5